MTYTILFVATLIAVSGLIAFLGDWLGRRMGKRRLTLFGMRPRYTAIVVTTITGMVIAALTLATMLAVSSSLREVFVRGERLFRENRAYQIANSRLHSENLWLTAAGKRLTKDVRDKSAQVRAAQKDVEAASSARDQARMRVQTLEADIRSRKAELTHLKLAGRLTDERLKQASRDLKDRKRVLADAQADLASKNDELAQRRRELASKKAELAEAEKSIRKAEAMIRQEEELIRQQQKRLLEEVQVSEMLLTGDVVLPQGQEIARQVIDGSPPAEQVRAELVNLLASASAEAASAEAGPDDGSPAIRLVFVDKATGQIVDDEKRCIDEAVKTIVEQGRTRPGHGVLARVTVVHNTVRGRRAFAELGLFWNNLLFHRGDTIASRMIDGRMSEGRTLLAVMDLLRENVRSAAQRKGIVPVASADPDKAAEPISDKQLDQLMELVQMIRSQDMSVEVRAVAKNDIYAAGPLNLDDIGFAINTLTSAAR